MEHLGAVALGLVDHLGYAGLLVTMALANIGAPIGSEVVLPAAGALVATGHLSNLWITIAVAVAGELLGGTVGYAIGLFGGRPFVWKYGGYVRFHHEQLARADAFFARWGTFAIFICRFVPVVRGIVAIPAGISRMNLAAFYLWTFLGSTIFCGALILAGNAFGHHLNRILPLLHKGATAVVAIALIAVVAAIVYAILRARALPKAT
ncbi:MAG: DedA family protein [Vulcanimicrobiaceae bacterium]